LLLDTGAAVTLLHQDVWTRIAAESPDLKPWSGASLVSAGGTPLIIHGCACATLGLGGKEFQTEFVVVSPLTSEAILGIDFLQVQRAIIDLGCGMLHLQESGCDISLNVPASVQSCPIDQQVRSSSTVEVPPYSAMEISANCDTEVEGVWLVEEATSKHLQVAVARAIVEPKSLTIPVRVLNMSDSPATLYAGSVIATMAPIEPPAEVDAMDDSAVQEVEEEKQQMLWQLVEDSGTELSPGEREIDVLQFVALTC